MIKLLKCLLLFCFFTNIAVAQSIQRKGGLGVAFYQQISDSMITALAYTKGAIVQSVLPGTTASQLGVRVHDIIMRVNDSLIRKPADLPAAAKNLRGGDMVRIDLMRERKLIKLKGYVQPRPQETSTTASVIYGEFAYGKGLVRTIYKAPLHTKPLATIYFLQGISCYSLDNLLPNDMTKQAIDALVDRGFAVYRMEKGDMGDNTGVRPCAEMGYNEELDMYKAGYRHLLQLPYVDTTSVVLFGHSMGGITAPLLAEMFQPRAIVVYGTVFKPWLDYLYDVYVLQREWYGGNAALLQQQLEKLKPAAAEFFNGNKSTEQTVSGTAGKKALEGLIDYEVSTGLAVAGRSPVFHRELHQQPVKKAWAATTASVLAIYGECDIAAIRPDDQRALVDFVNSQHPGKATFWLAPRTTHTFEEIGTMKEFINWQSNPQAYAAYAATRFNVKVFDHVSEWIKKILE